MRGKAWLVIWRRRLPCFKQSRQVRPCPSEMLSKWKTEMDGMGWTTKSIIDKLDFEQNRLGYSTRTDEELMRGFVRKHQRQNIAEHGPVEYGQPDQETKDRDNALVRGFLRLKTNSRLTWSSSSSTTWTRTKPNVRQLVSLKSIVFIWSKTDIEYYKDFLTGTITDPHEYRQNRFAMREMSFTTKEVLAQEQYMYDKAKARAGEMQFTITEQKAAQKLLAFEAQMSRELNKIVTCSATRLLHVDHDQARLSTLHHWRSRHRKIIRCSCYQRDLRGRGQESLCRSPNKQGSQRFRQGCPLQGR